MMFSKLINFTLTLVFLTKVIVLLLQIQNVVNIILFGNMTTNAPQGLVTITVKSIYLCIKIQISY